jgi:hypothetical protein
LRSTEHPLGADALALWAVVAAKSWSATNNKRSEVVMYAKCCVLAAMRLGASGSYLCRIAAKTLLFDHLIEK